MKAAVMRKNHAPLVIEEVEIDRPGPHEVLVRTAASGICHSDLHVIEGGLPLPPPTILGHEPAGVVEAVGAEVAEFAPGDHVIGCISAFCGQCEMCLRGKPYLCNGGGSFQRAADAKPRLSQKGVAIPQFANLSPLTTKGKINENAKVGAGDAPVRLLYVQPDGTLLSDPTEQVSMLPLYHNVDAFGYHSDVVSEEDAQSWAIFYDEDYKGKIGLLNDPATGLMDLALGAEATGLMTFASRWSQPTV